MCNQQFMAQYLVLMYTNMVHDFPIRENKHFCQKFCAGKIGMKTQKLTNQNTRLCQYCLLISRFVFRVIIRWRVINCCFTLLYHKADMINNNSQQPQQQWQRQWQPENNNYNLQQHSKYFS